MQSYLLRSVNRVEQSNAGPSFDDSDDDVEEMVKISTLVSSLSRTLVVSSFVRRRRFYLLSNNCILKIFCCLFLFNYFFVSYSFLILNYCLLKNVF